MIKRPGRFKKFCPTETSEETSIRTGIPHQAVSAIAESAGDRNREVIWRIWNGDLPWLEGCRLRGFFIQVQKASVFWAHFLFALGFSGLSKPEGSV